MFQAGVEGLGLGLALAKRFLALGGATITATSTPGVGSTFTLYLPQTYITPAQAPKSEALRQAKLEMIRSGKPPFYWAPFVLVGE